MIRRRTLLAAAPLALAACRHRDGGAAFEGGWIGAAHERGHRLRDAPSAPPGAAQRCSVAIVGSGIAGLAAARALLRAGIDDLRVFDIEDEAGGNSRGHTIGGMACPLGAHYLPLPGPDASEVAELLQELGLARTKHGRTVYDERHLCHSPQERLWTSDGQWREGLLPPAQPGSAREAQYRRFSRLVADVGRELRFSMPTARAPWTPGHAQLDAITFTRWLVAQGLDDEGLRWYLDYCCRDDYGAGSDVVSAWAGLHYFASRHGFDAPGDDAEERDAVLTWPEGNAWLARRLAAPLGQRLQAGRVVERVDEGRHDVTLDAWNARDGRAERWIAQRVVLAVPLHVAARIVVAPPSALQEASRSVTHAPWLVANLHLREPLTDKPGAPPSWDNVLYGSASLGYVDAMHQSLRPHPGPTVLTAYWALGGSAAECASNRARLLNEPWSTWAARVVADLARAHPDLPRKTARVDLMRYGHAMAIPSPGVRGSAALAALARPSAGRVHHAHSDLAGYSVFEEAFHHGTAAGIAAAAALEGARRAVVPGGALKRSASAPRSRPAAPARRG